MISLGSLQWTTGTFYTSYYQMSALHNTLVRCESRTSNINSQSSRHGVRPSTRLLIKKGKISSLISLCGIACLEHNTGTGKSLLKTMEIIKSHKVMHWSAQLMRFHLCLSKRKILLCITHLMFSIGYLHNKLQQMSKILKNYRIRINSNWVWTSFFSRILCCIW